MSDLIDEAHEAQQALRDTGSERKAARALGLTTPTLRRRLLILSFPLPALKAYREGRIARGLLWKLTSLDAADLEAMWLVLAREGRLIHADLSGVRREPTALIRRLQAAARGLKRVGYSEEAICELIRGD